ncbi:MAG: toll/interleukin-1 receptor domain-containing protein [Hyphomonadaceae bacterium]
MADVFISYSRADQHKADVIRNQLEALGLTVFYDQASLEGGSDFQDRISSELSKSGLVAALFSPTSLESKWVRAECLVGFNAAKLVPVLIQGPVSIPVPFNSIHCIDLTSFEGGDRHRGWWRFVGAVAERLKRPDLLDARPAEFRPAEPRPAPVRPSPSSASPSAASPSRAATSPAASARTARRAPPPRRSPPPMLGAGLAAVLALGAGGWGAKTLLDQQQAGAIRSALGEQGLADVAAYADGSAYGAAAAGKVASAIETIGVGPLEKAAPADPLSAYLAGIAYAWGLGVDSDRDRAGELFKRSCDSGYDGACAEYANAAMLSSGADLDRELVKRLQSACEAGNAATCFYADLSNAPDPDRMRFIAMRKACDGGLALGCADLATEYREGGRVVEKDAARAAELTKRACDLGMKSAC